MRLIMLGTGPFAVPTLRALARGPHEVLLVVSRPPRGREKGPSPMAVAASELAIEVWQPESVNLPESHDRLGALAPDLLVVCDYGEILAAATLATAHLGGINLHGSLLPKYRGAAPVQWAILRGEEETGNSVIQMTAALDAGPSLAQQRTRIDPDEDAETLETRLAEMGAAAVCEVIDQLASGTARGIDQEPAQASKAPRLRKEHGEIDWSRSAQEIKNQVRGLRPWPRAYTHWHRADAEPLRLVIDRAATVDLPGGVPVDALGQPPPGTVLEAASRLIVASGDGNLEILELQPAGKKSMRAGDFLRGNKLTPGDVLGRP